MFKYFEKADTGPLHFFAKRLTRTLFCYLVLADDVSFLQREASRIPLQQLALKLFKLSQYHYNHSIYNCVEWMGLREMEQENF
jgi:hypothetical protein